MQVHEVPKGLVRASLVMAGNAIFMAVAEIIIEILVVSGVLTTNICLRSHQQTQKPCIVYCT